MRNPALAKDYVSRATVRLDVVDLLYRSESWADVVRESQEAVELALKGLLRDCGIDPPRVHDVSGALLAERNRLPTGLQERVDQLAAISRDLRRDRELAFYGAEDLVPSEFYAQPDADRARDGARFVVTAVSSVVTQQGRENAGQ